MEGERTNSAGYQATMTERELQWSIIEAANMSGWWLVYHTLDSRGSQEGFPDIVLVGKPDGPMAGRLYHFELKPEKRKPTKAQDLWIRALQRVASSSPIRDIGAAVIRPRHLTDVIRLIETGTAAGELGLAMGANGSAEEGA